MTLCGHFCLKKMFPGSSFQNHGLLNHFINQLVCTTTFLRFSTAIYASTTQLGSLSEYLWCLNDQKKACPHEKLPTVILAPW